MNTAHLIRTGKLRVICGAFKYPFALSLSKGGSLWLRQAQPERNTHNNMGRVNHSRCWRIGGFALLVLNLSACVNGPAIDLAPDYKPAHFVVPESWHGASPFIEAKPSDAELRPDWWKLFNDPILDDLETQAAASNPDLQAAAERFIQARDMMLKARSRLLPQIGVNFNASNNKQSANRLFRSAEEPIEEGNVSLGGIASWEPDFWSAIRNRTRAQTYHAEERAADYALARLSLQAELATDYFILRGLDAQNATYKQSIAYYHKSLAIVNEQFQGGIASELDVSRAAYLLHSTESKQLNIENQRQVIEHAIAILVNRVPAAFSIEPVDQLKMADFKIPQKIPSTLLERRGDIAAMERRMAQANREIGIAKAAFYPNVAFNFSGGYEDSGFSLLKLVNSFWSYGSSIALPAFQGGYRRAQLQQAWSAYRETEDLYRSTVLNAFREVENGLSQTRLYTEQVERQEEAVGAAVKTQNLSMELFRGGLNSSLDLIYAQVNTLEARIGAVEVKTNLLKSSVALIRSLGGGFNRGKLPKDDDIQPFDVLQYSKLDKPEPAGGIDSADPNDPKQNNLAQPSVH